jgi:hypothetical protein
MLQLIKLNESSPDESTRIWLNKMLTKADPQFR